MALPKLTLARCNESSLRNMSFGYSITLAWTSHETDPQVVFVGGSEDIEQAQAKLDEPGRGVIEQQVIRNGITVRRRGYETTEAPVSKTAETLDKDSKRKQRT